MSLVRLIFGRIRNRSKYGSDTPYIDRARQAVLNRINQDIDVHGDIFKSRTASILRREEEKKNLAFLRGQKRLGLIDSAAYNRALRASAVRVYRANIRIHAPIRTGKMVRRISIRAWKLPAVFGWKLSESFPNTQFAGGQYAYVVNHSYIRKSIRGETNSHHPPNKRYSLRPFIGEAQEATVNDLREYMVVLFARNSPGINLPMNNFARFMTARKTEKRSLEYRQLKNRIFIHTILNQNLGWFSGETAIAMLYVTYVGVGGEGHTPIESQFQAIYHRHEKAYQKEQKLFRRYKQASLNAMALNNRQLAEHIEYEYLSDSKYKSIVGSRVPRIKKKPQWIQEYTFQKIREYVGMKPDYTESNRLLSNLQRRNEWRKHGGRPPRTTKKFQYNQQQYAPNF